MKAILQTAIASAPSAAMLGSFYLAYDGGLDGAGFAVGIGIALALAPIAVWQNCRLDKRG